MGMFVVFLIGLLVFSSDSKDETSFRHPTNIMLLIFFLIFAWGLAAGTYNHHKMF